MNGMNEKEMLEYMKKGAVLCQDEDVVDSSLYDKYGVKRGLRDLNGH
jgi:citrate synthase